MIKIAFFCIIGLMFNMFLAFLWNDYSIINQKYINILNYLKHSFLFISILLISYKDFFVKDNRAILNLSGIIYLFGLLPILSFNLNNTNKTKLDFVFLFTSIFTAILFITLLNYLIIIKNKKIGFIELCFNEIASLFVALNYLIISQTKTDSLNAKPIYKKDKSYLINKKSAINNFSIGIFITTIIYFLCIFVAQYINELIL